MFKPDSSNETVEIAHDRSHAATSQLEGQSINNRQADREFSPPEPQHDIELENPRLESGEDFRQRAVGSTRLPEINRDEIDLQLPLQEEVRGVIGGPEENNGPDSVRDTLRGLRDGIFDLLGLELPEMPGLDHEQRRFQQDGLIEQLKPPEEVK